MQSLIIRKGDEFKLERALKWDLKVLDPRIFAEPEERATRSACFNPRNPPASRVADRIANSAWRVRARFATLRLSPHFVNDSSNGCRFFR